MNLGVFLSIPLSEWLGKKRIFLASNISSMFGYFAVFLAPNFSVLLTARFFQVSAMGLADISPGVYLAEISTVKARGPMSGCNMTAGVVGTLFYTAICIILPIRFLSLAFAVHNMVVLLMVLLLPESPQWLVRKNKEEEAKAALLKLRGSTYQGIELEVDEIRLCTKLEEATSHKSLKQTFSSRQFTVPLATFSVVFLCVGLAGNDTMVFYGPTIFSQVATIVTYLPKLQIWSPNQNHLVEPVSPRWTWACLPPHLPPSPGSDSQSVTPSPVPSCPGEACYGVSHQTLFQLTG